MLCILALARRMADSPAIPGVRLDPVGTLLSAAGLGMVVFAIIRSGTWGFVQPKPGAPQWLGASPVIWLLLGGAGVLALFVLWESRQLQGGRPALIDPRLLRVPRLQAGLTAFFFQFLLQAGLFFVVPLFLSVALGLSAVATGVRLLPFPSRFSWQPSASPRCSPTRHHAGSSVSVFSSCCSASWCCSPHWTRAPGPRSPPGPCCWPDWASAASPRSWGQSRSRRCPSRRAGEVGGIQNTVTNLGASIGTALGRDHPHRGVDHDLPRRGRRQSRHPQGDVLAGPGGAVGRHPLRE